MKIILIIVGLALPTFSYAKIPKKKARNPASTGQYIQKAFTIGWDRDELVDWMNESCDKSKQYSISVGDVDHGSGRRESMIVVCSKK